MSTSENEKYKGLFLALLESGKLNRHDILEHTDTDIAKEIIAAYKMPVKIAHEDACVKEIRHWEKQRDKMNKKSLEKYGVAPFKLHVFKNQLSNLQTGLPVCVIIDNREYHNHIIGTKMQEGYVPVESGVYEDLFFSYGKIHAKLFREIPFEIEYTANREEYFYMFTDIDFDEDIDWETPEKT